MAAPSIVFITQFMYGFMLRIYIYEYVYNTSSYATIITHFIGRIMYNTSSYATIVTLNLYVDTSFLQMAAFRKL